MADALAEMLATLNEMLSGLIDNTVDYKHRSRYKVF